MAHPSSTALVYPVGTQCCSHSAHSIILQGKLIIVGRCQTVRFLLSRQDMPELVSPSVVEHMCLLAGTPRDAAGAQPAAAGPGAWPGGAQPACAEPSAAAAAPYDRWAGSAGAAGDTGFLGAEDTGGKAGPVGGAAGVGHLPEGQAAGTGWHQGGDTAWREPAGAHADGWGTGAGDAAGSPSADAPHQEATPGLMSAPPSAFSGWEPPSSTVDAAASGGDTHINPNINPNPDIYEEAPAHAQDMLGMGQDMGALPKAMPWALQGRALGGLGELSPTRAVPPWQPPPPPPPAWRPPPQARNLRHYMSGEQGGGQTGNAHSGTCGSGVSQACSEGPGPSLPDAALAQGAAAATGFQQPRAGSWAPQHKYDPTAHVAGPGSGSGSAAEAAQPAMGSPAAPGWPHDAPAWGPQPPVPLQQGMEDPYASGYAQQSEAGAHVEPWQAQPWQGMAEPQLMPPMPWQGWAGSPEAGGHMLGMPWQGSGDTSAPPPASTWQAGGVHAAAEVPRVPALQGPSARHGGQGGAAVARSAPFGASAASSLEPRAFAAWSDRPAAVAAAEAVPRAALSWAASGGAAAQVPGQWASAAGPDPQGFPGWEAAAAPRSAEEAQRSSAGRPPCAAVAWGFGGRVVLLRPGTRPSYLYPRPSVRRNKGLTGSSARARLRWLWF